MSIIQCVVGGWALPQENVSAVPYEEDMATHSSILAWQATVHGVKESDTAE